MVSAHMGDLISERLLRPVCSFPYSLSCPKLFFSISGDFLGIFKRALGGLQGLVCSQIIKEHIFTFLVFPFLALHCQLVVHCSEVDRREEKG